MWKATIHDNFTHNWCQIVVIGYSNNKINFYVNFDLIANTIRKKKEIACSLVTKKSKITHGKNCTRRV